MWLCLRAVVCNWFPPPISMTKEQEVLLMASMSQVWVSELHKEVNVMLRGITTHLRAHCTYVYPCLPTPGKLENRVPRLFIKYKLNNFSLSKIISFDMFHCLELTSGKGNLISFFQACSMNDQTQFTCLGFGLSFAIITQTCKLILNVYFSCEFCLLVFCFYLGFPMAPFYSEVVVCSWSPWASLHLRVCFQWRPKRTLKP